MPVERIEFQAYRLCLISARLRDRTSAGNARSETQMQLQFSFGENSSILRVKGLTGEQSFVDAADEKRISTEANFG
jgi:hypothetical protein